MQDFKTKVNEFIDELHMQMLRRQREDGAFVFCFEGPMMTNAFLIMLLKAVGDSDGHSFINWQKQFAKSKMRMVLFLCIMINRDM